MRCVVSIDRWLGVRHISVTFPPPTPPPPFPNTTYLLFNREPASRRFAHTFVGLHFDEFESQRLKRHTHKKQHRWHTHKHMLRGVYTTECTVIYWKGVSVLFSYASRPPPAGPLQVFNLFKIARFEMRRDGIKCLVRDKLCFFVNVSMVNDSMMME